MVELTYNAAFFVDGTTIFVDDERALAFVEIIDGYGNISECYNIITW